MSAEGHRPILFYYRAHDAPGLMRAILSTDPRIVWKAADASGLPDLIDATGPQCQLLVRGADRVRDG
jgi:hypothetical protein